MSALGGPGGGLLGTPLALQAVWLEVGEGQDDCRPVGGVRGLWVGVSRVPPSQQEEASGLCWKGLPGQAVGAGAVLGHEGWGSLP